MAWNEPGGNKDKDPWGGNRRNDGPPDLDEVFKNAQKKLSGIFGGGSGSSNSNGSLPGFSAGMLLVGLLIVAGLWAVKGIYQVDAKEQVVVLRLGKFNETVGEGLHWNPPLIDELFKEEVTTEKQYSTTGLMLTQDQNIVELPIKVQYRIGDIKSYVLQVKDPEASLNHATDSSLRHVVGSSTLIQVLSEGRAKIAEDVKVRLQSYLTNYETGIDIIAVNIQEGRPPKEVKAAFDDVIKAKEDEERFINLAKSYSNEIIPVARGGAQRVIEEASAYQEEVIAKAEGEAKRFELLLSEYNKAPEVTRKRLYLDAVQGVMENTSKVMVDVEGGNNMMYLPLDKIMSGSSSAGSNKSGAKASLSFSERERIKTEVIEQLKREASAASRSRGGR